MAPAMARETKAELPQAPLELSPLHIITIHRYVYLSIKDNNEPDTKNWTGQ